MITTKAPSPTDELMAKLAPHLAGLPSRAARLAFLQAKEAQVEEAYRTFISRVDRGLDPGKRTAFDYVETIAALHAEQAKYQRAAA